MNKISYVLTLLCIVPLAQAADESCAGGLTPFTCSDETGNIVLSRCATGNECYNKDNDGKSLRCCPVMKNTDVSKTAFLNLVKVPSIENLDQFKKSCNFSSNLDFENDNTAIQAAKMLSAHGDVNAIRGLFYAQAHCTDGASTVAVNGWLGNDLLVGFTRQLIQAFAEENEPPSMYKLVEFANAEWFAIDCVDATCSVSRKEYFGKKREALKAAKIPKSQEIIRSGLVNALKSDL